MPILDFQRTTVLTPDSDRHTVTIPPWHTGALGFIPNTEVVVRLQKPHLSSRHSPSHCEMYVHPFHTNQGRMFRLECTLRDRPGVVYRLLSAIAALGANIVKQDSCTFYGGPRRGFLHYVDLVLDWEPSGQFTAPIPVYPSDLWCYRYLRDRIPTHDGRYVQLFELIVLHCEDVDFDKAYGYPLPSIRITPFSFRSEGVSKTKRRLDKAKRRLHVALDLSRDEVGQICAQTRRSRHEPLPYLLSADGESRTLRVLFISADHARVLSVGFRHRDVPGVLATIGSILERAQLNILTAILRKESEDTSIWEVGLEHLRKGTTPPESTATEDPKFVADVLRDAHVPSDLLRKCHRAGVKLVNPTHGPHSTHVEIDLAEACAHDSSHLVSQPINSGHEQFATRYGAEVPIELIHALRRTEQKPGNPLVKHVYASVSNRVSAQKPVLFLSYSKPASPLAAHFKDDPAISETFDVSEYQASDWNQIFARSIEMIRVCDLFVGLWSHEPKIGVSTWLPFEYGVAQGLGKPAVLALDKQLPPAISKRLEPGIAIGQYSRDTFATQFLPEFVRRVCDEWKHHYVKQGIFPV